MTPASPPSVDPRTLIQHAGFLRSLAQSLVRHEAEAEDVAQDAWVRTLRRPPKEGGSSRAWLARVVTSVAQQRHRQQSRRRHHETEHARSVPSAEASGEREEQLQELVQAVAALEQPYRRAILERYFEGLKPAAIARRQDVPVTTVYSWIKRGHQRLREQLDERANGDRERWVLGLCLALGIDREADAAVVGSGGLSLSTGALLLGLVAAGTFGLVWFWPESRSEEDATVAEANGEAEPNATSDAPATADLTREASLRAPLLPLPSEAATSAPPSPVADLHRVSGLVTDPEGLPRAEVTLEFTGGRGVTGNKALFPTATSDGLGHYEIELAPGSYRLTARDAVQPWTTLITLTVSADGENSFDVSLQYPIRGRIVDAEGRGRAGLRVEARYFIPGWVNTPTSVTDAEGWFLLQALPTVPIRVAVLAADADRAKPPLWQSDVQPSAEPLEIVLDPGALQTASVSGQFLGAKQDFHGAVIDVYYGPRQASRSKINADGSFTLEDLAPGSYELQLVGAGVDWIFSTLELDSGEARDLGNLYLPPLSTLTLDFDTTALPPLETLSASIQPASKWATWGSVREPVTRLEPATLPPADYYLATWQHETEDGTDAYAAVTRVTLTEAPLAAPLPGSRVIPFTLELTGRPPQNATLLFEILGNAGRELVKFRLPLMGEEPTRVRLLLDEGDYLIRVRHGQATIGELECTVDAALRDTTVSMNLE